MMAKAVRFSAGAGVSVSVASLGCALGSGAYAGPEIEMVVECESIRSS